MTTRSKAEALALLEDTRRFFVDYGKWLAVQICNGPEGADTVFRSADVHRAFVTHPGLVHAKLVRDEMAARGLFDGYAGSMTWVGAVFRGPAFAPVKGIRDFFYSDEERNIHDKRLWWWEIGDHAKAGEYAEPSEPENYAGARAAYRKNEGRAYGAAVHRELALEAALVAIREHTLKHKNERDTIRSGARIEPAPNPILLPAQIEWLLRMTEVVS